MTWDCFLVVNEGYATLYSSEQEMDKLPLHRLALADCEIEGPKRWVVLVKRVEVAEENCLLLRMKDSYGGREGSEATLALSFEDEEVAKAWCEKLTARKTEQAVKWEQEQWQPGRQVKPEEQSVSLPTSCCCVPMERSGSNADASGAAGRPCIPKVTAGRCTIS